MALMSLRRRCRVKASMVLTRADNLFIHNYIRSLLMVRTRPEPESTYMYVCVSSINHLRATPNLI